MNAAIKVPAPDFVYERGIARASWAELAVALSFDLLRQDRRTGELSAEVTVSSVTEVVHRARLNLLSTRSRADFTNHLGRRMVGPDWAGLLELASTKVVEAYRQGSPAFLLRDAQEPVAAGWAMEPLLLARDPVIVFGDGGSLKSYTSLAAAVALQSGIPMVAGVSPARAFRVAYLDFEWNAWPHNRRLRALCGRGELPDILYVPCQTAGPLSHQVERIQRIFAEHHIDYAFIDSVGLACDGPPEEAQSALGFFQALSRLEVGSTLIAHTNREGDTTKPFGSAYWHNSARLTWYIKRERGTANVVDIGLYNRKANDGAQRQEPLGLRFAFEGETTTVSSLDVQTVPELDGIAPLRDRLKRALVLGAKTATELAAELEVPVNSVVQTAKRWDGKLFVKLINTPDGVHRIGLVAQGDSVT